MKKEKIIKIRYKIFAVYLFICVIQKQLASTSRRGQSHNNINLLINFRGGYYLHHRYDSLEMY